ncbi:diguanylate cyclase (GGDEF) domain-containing protein [Selenomonas sp. GACV-9]|uniref:putative bifunctional diguanylate cyclase/phosphodiesterase n=1 Tax=Selenomonas sp. GACV-9 TaxID=3158782 RepID=UPI0008EB381A|nr:diguanylate cyclase (GGDEF) domain-containing protein [Selenomonas ruminantium]
MDAKPVMLIVDDVEINRVVLSQFFQDEYAIVEAADGQEAMDALAAQTVSIVLLDLVMPVMDGFAVLAAMKRNDQYAQIPVIVMTAHNDGSSEERALELGAADFIVKPYNPTVVRCRVKNVMARQENEWRKVAQVAQDRQLAEMHRHIEKDALTGIDNREAFYRRTAALLQKNQDAAYSILYFDISCFKVINDIFHLDTGNLVLKTAAIYFQVLAGEAGTCGRIESDHFALCLPSAKVDMDNIMAGLDSTVKSLGLSHSIVFYAGVYPVDNAFLPVDQMCDRANMALTSIKGSYLQRHAYYDKSMRDRMFEEQMIVRDMEFALMARQFCVYLQPVHSLKENRIVSAEALVRWQHPTQGMIPPDRFISIFERNGFISRLDRFVWTEVCRIIKEQKARDGKALPISVNVSRLHFYDAGLLDFQLRLVKTYDLEPWMFRLEVDESAYTDNPYQMAQCVRALREHGFCVLLDDFGSGYSSLNMLKDLPVDGIKIDRSFVREVGQSERAGTIMEAIVTMAKKLAMGIVVEGVETKEQVDYLAGIGCENMQGYYYSRPVPEAEFAALLRNEADA